MSNAAKEPGNKTLLPDMPKDVPMPAYRYQRDERDKEGGGSQDRDCKVANLLSGLQLLGCAAANK